MLKGAKKIHLIKTILKYKKVDNIVENIIYFFGLKKTENTNLQLRPPRQSLLLQVVQTKHENIIPHIH